MPEPTAEQELRTLFQRACEGDKRAANQLVEQIGPLIIDNINRHIRGVATREAQQECWGAISKLFCRLAGLTNDAVIVTWIRKIVGCRCVDLLRAMRRQLKFSIMDDPSIVPASVSHNPHREFLDRLAQRLGSDERDVLQLRLEERSLREIALMLGLSLVRVTQLNRNILKLGRDMGCVEYQS
jgi:RNA polymerase sigma factor (sigma-70 family)